MLAEQGRASALIHREDRALLRSKLSPVAYLEAALSAKKCKELRRQHSRLSELGELRFDRRTDGEGLSGWIESFLALAHSGWQGAGAAALASQRATQNLFRDALAGAAARDKLERLTLSLDGQPATLPMRPMRCTKRITPAAAAS